MKTQKYPFWPKSGRVKVMALLYGISEAEIKNAIYQWRKGDQANGLKSYKRQGIGKKAGVLVKVSDFEDWLKRSYGCEFDTEPIE